MNKRILTICPSIYPSKLEKMMDSFLLTKSDNNKIIVNTEKGSITKIFNNIFHDNPQYDFYFMANDDMLFNTVGWDNILAKKGKISWGSDGIQNEGLCTFPMIDGDIVRILGWLQMPKLERYCGDHVWKFIGKECGILNYDNSVDIMHQWDGCTHPGDNIGDMARFAEWLPWAFRDIARIKEALNGKR